MTDDLVARISASANFGFLAQPALELAEDAVMAEAYMYSDPDASLGKARRFCEDLVRMRLRQAGRDPAHPSVHYQRIELLASEGLIPTDIQQLLHDIRLMGNTAVHQHYGDPAGALSAVEKLHQLGAWWHQESSGRDAPAPFTAATPELAASLRDLVKDIEGRLARLEGTAPVPAVWGAQDSASFLAFHTSRFGGRHEELARIKTAIGRPEPGYLLIEAHSGFGKSAVAAQLIHQARSGTWGGPPTDVAYFFIRAQRKEHTPTAFLQTVNAQLMEIAREWHPLSDTAEALRVQFAGLWAACADRATEERRLLLVVDGLDEAHDSGELSIPVLLPDRLAPYVHVLVTSRPNPAPLAGLPLEHPFQAAEIIRLGSLSATDIEEVVEQAAIPKASQPGLAGRIFRLTAGEPFFVRYACDAVAEDGIDALSESPTCAPITVQQAFEHQFRQLRTALTDDLAWRALAILTVAHGPLSFAELADILGCSTPETERALRPVMRHLVGSGAYEIPHARLRSAIEDYLRPGELDRARQGLRDWAARYKEQGWPDHTPSYLIDRYVSHLDAPADYLALTALVSPEWMRLKARHTGSHRAFAGDVLAAARAASALSPPDIVEAARCGLVLSMLRSLSGSLPDTVLEAMVRLGRAREAVDHAELQGDPPKRVAAFCAIARGAGDAIPELARHAVQRAADTIDRSDIHPFTMVDLVSALKASGDDAGAEQAATRLADQARDPGRRYAYPAVAYLAAIEALSLTGRQSQAAELAREFEREHPADERYPSAALGRRADLAVAYARAGVHPRARELAGAVRAEAARLKEESEKFPHVRRAIDYRESLFPLSQAAVAHAINGDLDESARTINEISEQRVRGEAMIKVAAIAAGEGSGQIAAQLAADGIAELKSSPDAATLPISNQFMESEGIGSAAVTLILSGHAEKARNFIAEIVGRANGQFRREEIDHFLAMSLPVLARVPEKSGIILRFLADASSPAAQGSAVAACAEAMAESGDKAAAAALARRVLTELAAAGPSGELPPAGRWPERNTRTFALLADKDSLRKATDIFLARRGRAGTSQELENCLAFIRIAENNLLGGRPRAARMIFKEVAKVVERAAHDVIESSDILLPGDSAVGWIATIWAQAARFNHLIGDDHEASRYAGRITALSTLKIGLELEIYAMCAEVLADSSLGEHGRLLLQTMIKSNHFIEGFPRELLSAHTRLFAELIGDDWVRDQLTISPDQDFRRKDSMLLWTARSWLTLGNPGQARKLIGAIAERKPGPDSIGDWLDAVPGASELLSHMGDKAEAYRCYTLAVNRLLDGDLGVSNPYSQFIDFLADSALFIGGLPGGPDLLHRLVVAVTDADAWVRKTTVT